MKMIQCPKNITIIPEVSFQLVDLQQTNTAADLRLETRHPTLVPMLVRAVESQLQDSQIQAMIAITNTFDTDENQSSFRACY